MRKMKLSLDELAVETFEVTAAGREGTGTVFGRIDAAGEDHAVAITARYSDCPVLCTVVEPTCENSCKTDCESVCYCRITEIRDTCV